MTLITLQKQRWNFDGQNCNHGILEMELVNRFYEYTEPGGYLFIGHSESLNRDETKYKYVMPAVYRKE